MTPVVLGLSAEAASARLVAKGFEVDLVQPLYDENVALGEVIKLTIDGEIALGGSLREPGTSAVLIVSGGPVPRSVPQLTSLDLGAAERRLDSVQLTLARPLTYEVSETVPEGAVIRQSLVAGLLVDRGSLVSLTLSSGPDRREVPDMRGLNITEAKERLTEVGLKVGEIAGEGGVVQATEPPAGTMLAPNATVVLWVIAD
jgi:serine/threonine-protein kinase